MVSKWIKWLHVSSPRCEHWWAGSAPAACFPANTNFGFLCVEAFVSHVAASERKKHTKSPNGIIFFRSETHIANSLQDNMVLSLFTAPLLLADTLSVSCMSQVFRSKRFLLLPHFCLCQGDTFIGAL